MQRCIQTCPSQHSLNASCVSSRADELMHLTPKLYKLTEHMLRLKAGHTSCSVGHSKTVLHHCCRCKNRSGTSAWLC